MPLAITLLHGVPTLYIVLGRSLHLVTFAGANFAISEVCGTRSLRVLGTRQSLAVLCSWCLFVALLILREYGRRPLKVRTARGAENT